MTNGDRVHVVARADEGRSIPRPETGGTVTITVASHQSGGAVTVYTSERLAGDRRGPGMHAHPGFDETFYVLQGEYEFAIGSDVVRAEAGTTLFIPRGTFHDFHASGTSASKLLTICTPGGIEDFFEDSGRVAAHRLADEVDEVRRKHGFHFSS